MSKSLTMKNRNKELLRIKEETGNKFKIMKTKKVFPGQSIRLYSDKLQDNFPGQILKELNPSEYLRQKQKLQVHKNRQTRKYNKSRSKTPNKSEEKSPRAKSKSIRTLKNLQRAMEEYKKMEKEKKSKNKA